MNPGELNRRITIEEIVTANNVQNWSVFANAWASVRGGADEREITIRYRSGITTSMYVKCGTEVLAVKGIKDPDGHRSELLLSCKKETVEELELQKATETEKTGRISKIYTKAADLLGVVLPKDPDIEQRHQGTIYKRQFAVHLKGEIWHAAMAFGHGMKVRNIDCEIRDVQSCLDPEKLVVFKLRER